MFNEKSWYKIMSGFVKRVFIRLLSVGRSLACVAEVSDRINSVSMNNQPCQPRPTIIDVNSNETLH